MLEAARAYHNRGWRPTPLDGKKPTVSNWQNRHYLESELGSTFPAGRNIGVVLGSASGGLADVDLDCVEARWLASTFLPPTPAKFGRDSSPRSHWLYQATPSSFKTERLADPDDEASPPGDHKGALVELRGDNCQTMAPPSVHPCGEPVQWASNFDTAVPSSVNLDELRKAVRKLAAGSLLARRWKRLPRHDATLALTGALLQGGFSVEDAAQFVLAVADDDEPDDRRRAVEDTLRKFVAGLPVAGAAKCKELFGDRAWAKAADWLGLRYGSDWEALDPSILREHKYPASELPLEVFGEKWGSWIVEQGAAKSAPADFVAGPLLSTAGGLIGNARKVSPWSEWIETPIIWMASIGSPSSGKSPAADSALQIVHQLEKELAEDFPEKLRQWEQRRAQAKAVRTKWEGDLKTSLKDGTDAGELPTDAIEPDRPRFPHLVTTDSTPEAIGYNLAGLPKGILQHRDELGGWMGAFDRYGGGKSKGERDFWIEAYGGRPYKIDRVSHKEAPLYIPALTISVCGGIQPERLTSLLLDCDDDGLTARIVYVWPDPVLLERPPTEQLSSPALGALRKLRDLSMESYRVLRLTEDAAHRFQAWRVVNANSGAGTSGMFQSWLGKMPGLVLRLALVLRYLRWCSEDGAAEEPKDVDLDTTASAIKLVDGYFIPMARRVFGDAAQPEPERDATAIARLILGRKIGVERAGRYILNARKDVQRRGINRIRTANQARAALDELREAGWVRPTAPSASGRPRGDYEVNPGAFNLEVPKMRCDRVSRSPSAPWRAAKTKYQRE